MDQSRRYSRRGLLKAGAVLGAGAGLSPLLAACGSGGSSGSNGKATLNVWMVSEPSRTWIQNKMVSTFEAKYPKIKLNITKTDFTTYYQKLATNIAGGTVPDVFMMSGAYFYQAAHLSALYQLDKYMSQDGIKLSDYYTESSGEDELFQGHTYGIPGEIDVLALAYNKDMFDEKGVSYPTADWTWDDMLAAAEKLTYSKGGKAYYGLYSWNSAQEMWGDLVLANGGSFLNEDLTQGALGSSAAVEAIQFAADLIHKYKVSPTAQGASSLPGYLLSGGNPFLTGLVGMKYEGNYELDLLANVNNFKWDVVPLPKKVKHSGLGWYQSWAMGANTQYPDESWELLKFLVTEGQTITASAPGRGLTPSLKSAATSKAFLGSAPPHVVSWLDAWDEHGSFGFHPAWFQYQDAYSSALDNAFSGSASVKSAIASATPQVNQALSQYPWFNKAYISNG
jgi:multiple sugar transport system substrate-binding protein